MIVGIGDNHDPGAPLVDVVVPTLSEAEGLAHVIAERPIASTTLALLLRHGERRSVAAGLVAESAAYSMLQSGSEYAAWLRRRRDSPPAHDSAPPVLVNHTDGTIEIVLNRPERHNAVNLELKERLVAALAEALLQPDCLVRIRGNGPSFCSGGDLAEFGSYSDPASANAVRLTRSAGILLSQLAGRVEVHLHGSCLGAGIELPAYAANVVCAADTRIALPEVGLGLLPGAGGTISLPNRIGRRRTAWLALTGATVSASTALEWGLVDGLAS